MKFLWLLLLAYFRLAVPADDPPADDPPADDPPSDDPPSDDPPANDDPAADETPADYPPAESPAEIRARQLEEENTRLRAESEAARRPAPAPHIDPVWAEEERQLRDPATDKLTKWQIESNRALRQSQATAQNALFQAQDLNDKTSFDSLRTTNPAIHKKYSARVEAELTRMRSTGQNASREAILRFFIGDDAIKGNVAPPPKQKPVDRGRSPGVRSDVRGNGRLSESQAREKRLTGVNI